MKQKLYDVVMSVCNVNGDKIVVEC